MSGSGTTTPGAPPGPGPGILPAPPDPADVALGAAVAVSAEQRAEMNDWILILIQDHDGVDTYSNAKATLGYLETELYLNITTEYDAVFDPIPALAVDLEELGKKDGIEGYMGQGSVDWITGNSFRQVGTMTDTDFALHSAKMTVLNYIKLVKAGLSSPDAFVCAALRTRWTSAGAYTVTKKDTSTAFDETSIINNADPVYGRLVAAATLGALYAAMGKFLADFLAAKNDPNYGENWVTLHAENIWAAVEYVFRVRGHHFKTNKDDANAYASLYLRFLTAAYEGNFDWPAAISMFHVFHTAIHPFKLKALPVMTAHFVAYGKVARSAIIRMSGSPCGHAAVTTAAAALNTMRSEAWWNSFYKAYKEMVEITFSVADQVNNNKYGYHISAMYYGLAKATEVEIDKKAVSITDAKDRVSSISAACQGLINGLALAKEAKMISSFALSNAKALEKPAAANPLLAIRITALVTAAVNAVSDQDDIAKAIAGALPTLTEGGKDEEKEKKTK